MELLVKGEKFPELAAMGSPTKLDLKHSVPYFKCGIVEEIEEHVQPAHIDFEKYGKETHRS